MSQINPEFCLIHQFRGGLKDDSPEVAPEVAPTQTFFRGIPVNTVPIDKSHANNDNDQASEPKLPSFSRKEKPVFQSYPAYTPGTVPMPPSQQKFNHMSHANMANTPGVQSATGSAYSTSSNKIIKRGVFEQKPPK